MGLYDKKHDWYDWLVPGSPTAAGYVLPGVTFKDIGNFANDITGKNSAMEKQQQLNLELQKKQYTNSVQGMKEAGLNPAMMYANSSASSPSGVGQASSANTGFITSLPSVLNSAANFARSFNGDKNPSNDVSFREVARTVREMHDMVNK